MEWSICHYLPLSVIIDILLLSCRLWFSKVTRLKRYGISIAIGILGLCFLLGVGKRLLIETPIDSDFSVFRAGAWLRGNISIYDPQTIKSQINGKVIEARAHYLRWPWYSFVTYPLSKMSHCSAFIIWRVLSLAAIVAALFLWPSNRDRLAVATCWSLPLLWTIAFGSDISFVLGLIALGVWLIHRNQQFNAGLVLSVAASLKPHLLLFLLLVFIIQKLWRSFGGWIVGTTILFISSAALAGFAWPIQYLKAVMSNEINPYVYAMPGFGRLWPNHPLSYLLCFAALVCALVYVSQRRNLENSIPIALTCGILASPHSYAVDLVLLIPLAAISSISNYVRWTTALVLSPILVLILLSKSALPLQIALLVIIWGTVTPMLKTRLAEDTLHRNTQINE
jgi:hypothetical protein